MSDKFLLTFSTNMRIRLVCAMRQHLGCSLSEAARSVDLGVILPITLLPAFLMNLKAWVSTENEKAKNIKINGVKLDATNFVECTYGVKVDNYYEPRKPHEITRLSI